MRRLYLVQVKLDNGRKVEYHQHSYLSPIRLMNLVQSAYTDWREVSVDLVCSI